MSEAEKKISPWKSFLIDVLLKFVILGLLLFFFQKRIEHNIKPLTAAEILKKENYLNAKKDAYYEAIEIVNRIYATSDWSGPIAKEMEGLGRNAGTEYPSEIENNMVYNKLCLYADSKEVPNKFRDFFDPTKTKHAPLLCEFINILKKDLGYDDWYMECEEEFIRIYTTEKKFNSKKE